MQSDNEDAALDRLLGVAAHNPSINAVREGTRFTGEIVDFCVPVNPYFPTPQLLQRLQARLPDLLKHYPDYADTHEQHIAAIAGVPAANVVAANGSTEIITALCRTAAGPMLTTVPTFGRWTDLPVQWGTPLHVVAHRRTQGWHIDVEELIAEALRTRAGCLVVCNPNNPTGAGFAEAELARLAQSLSHLDAIVIDESFIDFSTLASARRLAIDGGNVIVVKSLGKSLGWHGMRLGYAVANRAAAQGLRAQLPWWNVNGVAGFVLKELAESGTARAAFAESFGRIAADRDHLQRRLAQVPGLTVWPSHANFLYAELPAGCSGKVLRAQLLQQHGLFVRECGNKLGSSESFLRIAVLPPAASDRLADALAALLRAPPPPHLAYSERRKFSRSC